MPKKTTTKRRWTAAPLACRCQATVVLKDKSEAQCCKLATKNGYCHLHQNLAPAVSSKEVQSAIKASESTSTASKPVQATQTAILAKSATESLPEAQNKSLSDRLEDEFKDLEIGASKNTVPHLIVSALAGTGKTTTLIEGIKKMKGIESKLTPSPQQALVWEQMELSKSDSDSVCFVAFNKSIATELQTRMPAGCQAMTLHSLGNKACFQAYGKLRLNQYRVQDLLSDLTGLDTWELRKKKPMVVSAVEDLVALCKQNLIGLTSMEANEWEEELDELCSYYDIELNGSREEVFKLVPQVLNLCKAPYKDNCMDFNDMIWLPVVNNLPCNRYKVLLVDECQDLNRCQQALAMKSGDRLILCGDKNQAIYGFAGADAESMDRMAQILNSTPRGCKVLPLTVTRRCSKLVVKEAQTIVAEFEAHESNHEGIINRMLTSDYTKSVNDGDFILCRVNGPLVSQCFRFLKEGRKANIQGRDVGQGLISTVKKLMKGKDWDNVTSVVDLITALDSWYRAEEKKELAKRNPSDSRLIALEDRKSCLEMFCKDMKSVNEVIRRIESIFTDNTGTGIRLSSIHKSKGLEARRVFLLEPKGATVPHPMAKSDWQRGQEMNLRYVAITRSIEELIYVTEG